MLHLYGFWIRHFNTFYQQKATVTSRIWPSQTGHKILTKIHMHLLCLSLLNLPNHINHIEKFFLSFSHLPKIVPFQWSCMVVSANFLRQIGESKSIAWFLLVDICWRPIKNEPSSQKGIKLKWKANYTGLIHTNSCNQGILIMYSKRTRTCHLLCRRPECYHSTSKTRVHVWETRSLNWAQFIL